MKTVKSSLLLLILFFGVGTFAQAQNVEVPCTEENIRGLWIQDFNSGFGEVRWSFDPFRSPRDDMDGHVGCIAEDNLTCSQVYPMFGIPFLYRFNGPGQITISWSGAGDINYGCFRVGERLFLSGGFVFTRFGGSEEISVPTLSEWGLIAMAGVLGLVGFMVIRRKRVTL